MVERANQEKKKGVMKSPKRLMDEKGNYIVWTANCKYEGSWCAGLRICKLKGCEVDYWTCIRCEHFNSKKK